MSSAPRWQLNRAGITNVYQYEHEVLTFRGGRLLLRGINGSGKSTAMNMLLPFLLTGRTRGIDAAGEQTGILKSWMLSGRNEKQPVGYLWVEFEQVGVNGGEAMHLTLGCGIKANRASDTVITWWFVTEKQPGIDFELLEAQVPLSLDALRATLEPDPVFTQDKRSDYRREVTRRLYGGADIESYLTLINTVRNPRVGDRVDLDLPQYLVAAMPNLSETALIEAARPLDDLDEHRRNVSDLGSTSMALTGMLEVYQQYAQTVLHAEVESAQNIASSVKRARRQARQATKDSEEAQLAEEQARERSELLEHQRQQFDQEILTLQGSSAYTDGLQLEDLRRHVQSLESRVQHDQAALDEHRRRQPAVIQTLTRGEQQSDDRLQLLVDELSELTQLVDETGIGATLPSVTPVPRLALSGVKASEPLEDFDADTVNRHLAELAGTAATRVVDVDTARGHVVRVQEATNGLSRTQAALQQSSEAFEDSRQRFDHGRRDLDLKRQFWLESLTSWKSNTADVVASINSAQVVGVGELPVAFLSVESTRAELHAQRGQLEVGVSETVDVQQRFLITTQARVAENKSELKGARQELDELNARTEPDVPVLSWQQRSGPSLADVVDFHDALGEESRAGLEAALEAGGLLLASVEQGGSGLRVGELFVSESSEAVEHSLGTVLKPCVPENLHSVIDEKRVQRLLDSISTRLASGCASIVTVDGEFRLGAISGRHEKAEAEYVGVSARRARLERLRREAASRVELAEQRLEEAQVRLQMVEGHARQLRKLRDDLPSLSAVDRAQSAAVALEDELEKARERQLIRETAVSEAEQRLSVAEDECQRTCRSLALPYDAAGLDRVERSLRNIKMQVQSAVRSAGSVAIATQDWTQAVQRYRLALADMKKANVQWQTSHDEWDNEHTRLATLEATLGASYQEVIEQIDAAQRLLKEAKQQIPGARQQTESAIRLAQDAVNEANQMVEIVRSLERECTAAHSHLVKVLNVPGLLPALSLNDSASTNESPQGNSAEAKDQSAAIPATTADPQGIDELARFLQLWLAQAQVGSTTADGVRISLRRRRDSLGAGWDAEDQQPDPGLPMSISVTGPLGQMPLAISLSAVRTQLSQLKALLTEKQDQALRNLLQGLIAREVAERMFEAKRLIERMNVRLLSVTTSHGIGVRLRWRRSAELDETTGRTVDILSKTPDLRTEEEEVVLREALAQQLEEARRLNPDAAYRNLIAQVFDYRRWHEMAILLRRGDEPEKRLTRRTPLSEGEKKLVSYLPLFAAVAAACDAMRDAGGEQVPRFLLLDDAFAKVSEDNHAALFGLLVSLDLDFIATSERLWGTHASVPGLAITEVVRDTALGAILLEHSLWDGQTLTLPSPVNTLVETWEEVAVHE